MSALLRRVAASVLAWIVGATAAVAVGLLALSLLGDSLTGNSVQPLQPDAVAREVSVAPSTSAGPVVSGASPGPSASASVSPRQSRSAAPTAVPSGVSADRLVTSTGGSAVARCTSGGLAYLVSWSPAPGYKVDGVLRGPAAEVHVDFEALGKESSLNVTCVNGVPQPRVGH